MPSMTNGRLMLPIGNFFSGDVGCFFGSLADKNQRARHGTQPLLNIVGLLGDQFIGRHKALKGIMETDRRQTRGCAVLLFSPSSDSSALTTAALNAPVFSEKIVLSRVARRHRHARDVAAGKPFALHEHRDQAVLGVADVPTATLLPLRSEIFWISAAASKYQVTFSV